MGRKRIDRDQEIRAALNRLLTGTHFRSKTGALNVASLATEAVIPRDAVYASPVYAELQAHIQAAGNGHGPTTAYAELQERFARSQTELHKTQRRNGELQAEINDLHSALSVLDVELAEYRRTTRSNVRALHPK